MSNTTTAVGFDPSAGIATLLPINSFSFALLALAAILGCRFAPRLAVRQVVLCLLNIYFLHYFLHTVYEALLLVFFLLTVFIAGRIKQKYPQLWPAPVVAVAIVALWVFLFLVRDPTLIPAANPFSYYPVRLIGISYIVFRCISYLMEVDLTQRSSLPGFFNYVVFFPTFIAGPIERYSRFTSAELPPVTAWREQFYPALNRILNGLIKKFVLADNLMVFGIFALSQEGSFSIWLLWFGALVMLFLIYLDFSGYCDIVIGLANLMGIQITENFNRPFAARNVQEFWKRWHMSLSSLIQDYVFTPINKAVIQRVSRQHQFLLITLVYLFSMILVAMWHGTTVGFLIFGALHGGALVLMQLKRRYRLHWVPGFPDTGLLARIGTVVACCLTYCFISISLIWWFHTLPHAINTFKLLLGLS